MSYRVPVITSNYGAPAEVAGDAALLVDPYNIDEISKTMYKVLIDQNLRKELIEKGLKRTKEFSWEKAAKETLKVYEEAYRR
ncbi:glycosyltransferase [Candidatus Aerophobetes bacterium]|nr:glycosyltransferase [Candidatus Aerophobetes bacterium]